MARLVDAVSAADPAVIAIDVLFAGADSRSPAALVRNLAALFGLDPLRAETVKPPPFFEHRPKTYDMQERTLTPHASDRRAVVVVEIAMHRDSAILGKRDRLFDLASLKVPFAHRCR